MSRETFTKRQLLDAIIKQDAAMDAMEETSRKMHAAVNELLNAVDDALYVGDHADGWHDALVLARLAALEKVNEALNRQTNMASDDAARLAARLATLEPVATKMRQALEHISRHPCANAGCVCCGEDKQYADAALAAVDALRETEK